VCQSAEVWPSYFQFTNNGFADVGKGAALPVPSLRGVSFRVPLMHDGCAQSLRDRFEPACGGGDRHGHTSQLEPPQIDELIAYLETTLSRRYMGCAWKKRTTSWPQS
jgi:cytochrome c peroxidase